MTEQQINNTVVTWLGVDISTMSKEELEIAFRQLGEQYQGLIDAQERRMKRSINEMYELAEKRVLHG
jgi:hypothetical protein